MCTCTFGILLSIRICDGGVAVRVAVAVGIGGASWDTFLAVRLLYILVNTNLRIIVSQCNTIQLSI